MKAVEIGRLARGRIIAANWLGDLGEHECAEYYDEICWRALAVRQYLEARSEVEKHDSNPKRSGPPLH